jgi:hypothetical protein
VRSCVKFQFPVVALVGIQEYAHPQASLLPQGQAMVSAVSGGHGPWGLRLVNKGCRSVLWCTLDRVLTIVVVLIGHHIGMFGECKRQHHLA